MASEYVVWAWFTCVILKSIQMQILSEKCENTGSHECFKAQVPKIKPSYEMYTQLQI